MRKTSITLLLLSLGHLANSQNIDSKIREIVAANNLVGLSVCLVKSDTVVFSGHYGWRDVNRKLPVDKNTVFRVASISKMVTATALMQLFDKGLFQLDDDVSPYLGFELLNPNFPDVPVTFSMLLSHTSGLRDGTGYDSFLMASYRQKPFPNIQSVVKPGGNYYTSDMWSNNFGEQYFTYANINYGLLGTIVERMSGERFDKYCIRNIFKPLGIQASFDIRDIPDVNNVAAIYRKTDGEWTPQTDDLKGQKPAPRELDSYITGTNAVLFAPQGGLRISDEDLSRFMMMHMNNGELGAERIISQSSALLIRKSIWKFNGENGITENGFFTNYGLGCMYTENLVSGVGFTGHSGDAYGLLSGMYFSEETGIGIIFITNGGEWKSAENGWQTVETEIVNACYQYLNK